MKNVFSVNICIEYTIVFVSSGKDNACCFLEGSDRQTCQMVTLAYDMPCQQPYFLVKRSSWTLKHIIRVYFEMFPISHDYASNFLVNGFNDRSNGFGQLPVSVNVFAVKLVKSQYGNDIAVQLTCVTLSATQARVFCRGGGFVHSPRLTSNAQSVNE